MNKPITLIVEDKKQEMIDAINGALNELSPVIVEPILKLLYLEVLEQKNKTIEQDNLNYQRQLFEEQQLSEETKTEILDVDGNVVDTIKTEA